MPVIDELTGFTPPTMIPPADYPSDTYEIARKKYDNSNSITLETKAYTVLLDLFAALHAYRKDKTPGNLAAVWREYERADAFYWGGK